MKAQSRLMQQIHFIVEADKLKNIFRQSRLINEDRKENDAEHSWHLALMLDILSEYAPPNLNLLKTMQMLIIHDLVEIEAGDTLVYDTEARDIQAEKEKQAAKKIFALLPEDQNKRFLEIWNEFEARQTQEAKFARALDRLQPLILNYFSKGQTWLEHSIDLQKVMEVNQIIAEGSPELWEFAQALIRESDQKGYFS